MPDARGRAFCMGQAVDAQSKSAWSWCLQAHHLCELVEWQPPTRFREFQWIEPALVIGIALTLLLLTAWWLRSRPSGSGQDVDALRKQPA